MQNQNGFTLLEIVLSLMLVGIMVSVVGVLMIVGVQEYVSSKENVAISQKASLALKRIEKEMQGMTMVDAANSDSACIRYKLETDSQYYRALGVTGRTLELKVLPGADCDCATQGNIIVDQVAGFVLSYEDQSSDPSTISSTPPINFSDLSEIRISFTMDHESRNIQKTFELRVSPRNNGNLNSPGVQL